MNIKDPRICAICLRDIERDLYDEHMQQAHGGKPLFGSYDRLEITAEDVLSAAEYPLVQDSEIEFWDPT
jgi:hypothetical protein